MTQQSHHPPDLATGDPEAVFTRLFDDHAPAIHRYLASRVGTATADDLTSETFLIALQKRAAYDPMRAAVRSWLYGIATNLVRRHVAAEVRHLRLTAMAREMPVAAGHAEVVADRVDAEQRVRHLAVALGDLNEGDRDVLLLSCWADLNATEIGEALGIPAATVRTRLHRVRRLLRTTTEVGRDADQ